MQPLAKPMRVIARVENVACPNAAENMKNAFMKVGEIHVAHHDFPYICSLLKSGEVWPADEETAYRASDSRVMARWLAVKPHVEKALAKQKAADEQAAAESKKAAEELKAAKEKAEADAKAEMAEHARELGAMFEKAATDKSKAEAEAKKAAEELAAANAKAASDAKASLAKDAAAIGAALTAPKSPSAKAGE